MTRGNGDFLARWSQRKLTARTEPEPEPAPPAPTGAAAEAAARAEPEKSDEEILHELGLPDPDTMVKGDDFSAFLRAGVPARLRTRALRRLWVSDPVLANLDGLNDYEQDFTDAATVVKDLKTAYKVGRGFLLDEEDAATAATAAKNAEPVAAPDGTAAVDETGPAVTEANVRQAGAASTGQNAPAPDQPGSVATGDADDLAGDADDLAGDVAGAPDEAPPRPRPMRFRFSAE